MAITESGGGPANPAEELERLADLATPFAMRAAASLRVAEHIAAGSNDLDRLAAACGADRDALGRMLRYLAHRGVFAEPSPDVFELTEVGALLCDRSVTGKGGWLDLGGFGARSDLAYGGLLHSVRTGEPGYASVHGRTYWEDLNAEPSYGAFFDDLMLSQQAATAPQVATLYDWASAGHVIDVGGGRGGLLAEVLRTHPRLRGTLVDRPDAARAAVDKFADAGLADRAEVVAGDFFEPLPRGGDVYVVSRVLTDWSDRHAAAILRRCAEAVADSAAESGRVLVVEVLPTQPYVPYLSPYDLAMLVLVGGRERSEADHIALAATAGLRMTATMHGADGLTLIEFAVAG